MFESRGCGPFKCSKTAICLGLIDVSYTVVFTLFFIVATRICWAIQIIGYDQITVCFTNVRFRFFDFCSLCFMCKDLAPRTMDLGPRTEDQGPRFKDHGSRVKDLGARKKDQGPRIENQGPRAKDRGPRTDDQGSRA